MMMIWLQNKLGALREKLKGWKTLIFGAVVSASSSALELLDALRAIDIAPLLPPTHALRIIAAIGLATIVLRLMTTGSVGEKER